LAALVACATGRPSPDALNRRLRHSNPDVRVETLDRLAKDPALAKEVLPALLENFRDRREPVHRASERTLSTLRETGAEALGSLLSDRDSWVRCRAAAALAPLAPYAKGAISPLVEALHDSDFCVTEKSAIALGAIGEPAVPILLEALKSSDATYRKGAAEALGYMSPAIQSRVAGALLPSLKSPDEFVRGEAAMRITNMGKLGIPVFLTALKEPDVDLRQRAVDGLGEIGVPTPEVVDALIALFRDPQRTIRLKASVVLGRMGQNDPSVYKRVAPELASKEKEVILGTLRALGDMGSVAEPSLPQIVYLMDESPDSNLRTEAAESLIKMGTRASMAEAERFTRSQYRRSSE
jgi:HEAT repeat protein